MYDYFHWIPDWIPDDPSVLLSNEETSSHPENSFVGEHSLHLLLMQFSLLESHEYFSARSCGVVGWPFFPYCFCH